MTRLNFTGRRRLHRRRLDLLLDRRGNVPELEVRAIDLSGMALDAEALVVLEVYHQTNYLRINCGTVTAMRLGQVVSLPQFAGIDAVLFRVKVVGQSGVTRGQILAVADRVPPSSDGEPGARIPLLPFRSSDELDHRVWRLDLSGERPEVVISSRVGNWRALARQPEFVAMVYPEILRRVASWVAENLDETEDPTSAIGMWSRFLRDMGADPSAAGDDVEEWADEIATGFARRKKLLGIIAGWGDST